MRIPGFENCGYAKSTHVFFKQSFKPLAYIYGFTAWLVSDLVKMPDSPVSFHIRVHVRCNTLNAPFLNIWNKGFICFLKYHVLCVGCLYYIYILLAYLPMA